MSDVLTVNYFCQQITANFPKIAIKIVNFLKTYDFCVFLKEKDEVLEIGKLATECVSNDITS